MAIHLPTNDVLTWIRIPRQQLSALYSHAVVAIPALRSVLIDERLLQWMHFRHLRKLFLACVARGKSLESNNRFPPHVADRRDACSGFNTVDKNRARPALGKTAAQARPL